MSKTLIRNLRELNDSIKANAPIKRMDGSLKQQQPDMAVKISVGKYFDALKRLANE